MYHELIERLAIRLPKVEGWDITKDVNHNHPRIKVYLAMAKACLTEIDTFIEEEGVEFKDLEVSTRYQMSDVPNSSHTAVLQRLVETVAVKLAKTNGWEIENIHVGNPRIQGYLNMAESCLDEINSCLKEIEIEFEDLEVNARYEMPIQ